MGRINWSPGELPSVRIDLQAKRPDPDFSTHPERHLVLSWGPVSPFWTAKNVTIPSYPLLEDNNWFSEETEPNSGCLPFTKTSREIRLETWSWWNTTSWVVPVENSREQRKTWKGSPVFPEGMFQTEIRVPLHQSNLCYQFKAFVAVVGTDLYIGKRDSGTPEIYQFQVLRTIYPNRQ